jgi:hypothetical protein
LSFGLVCHRDRSPETQPFAVQGLSCAAQPTAGGVTSEVADGEKQ